MKKISILCFLLLFLTVGCNLFEEKTGTLIMNCDGDIKEFEIKKDTIFHCDLLGESYYFEVTNVTNTYAVITTRNDGLSNGPGIWESEHKWKVYGDSELSIHTNTTDTQGKVTLKLK